MVKINPDNYKILTTPEFKLKDRPINRRMQPINLKKHFVEIPETIIIEKAEGKNNTFVAKAFVKKKNNVE